MEKMWELGFGKTGAYSLKEQAARTVHRNVRAQGHTYVELREDNKFIYFCTVSFSVSCSVGSDRRLDSMDENMNGLLEFRWDDSIAAIEYDKTDGKKTCNGHVGGTGDVLLRIGDTVDCNEENGNLKPKVLIREEVSDLPMFRLNCIASDARRAWMKNPELLQNCSVGFHFRHDHKMETQEKVMALKLLHLYNSGDWLPEGSPETRIELLPSSYLKLGSPGGVHEE
ncbi:hypothetical protein MLD38_003091 [Melastoma candidum]|uniref:Uncharacterized protein n=1 Tax=Melastoma candidum TaxID=119954 RepID=A0ACB9S147_9MYRT|nr:hypothetical protein MLD38_003091 [Melastoma candidum]